MARQSVWRRVKACAGAVVMAAAILVVTEPARAQEPRGVATMFTQQDAVQSFDFATGKGYQIGTATGRISGTTFVSFQFAPSGPPVGDELPITFHNEVIVTDIDGDQLFFDNDGTGTFHLGVPGASFRGSGGPLRGTYVLTGATGKYVAEWKIGTTLDYKAIATNPPSPTGALLGTVYVQLSARDKHAK
jgi:hypothetical protein